MSVQSLSLVFVACVPRGVDVVPHADGLALRVEGPEGEFLAPGKPR